MAAKTRGDLVGLFDDLPDLEAPDGDSGPAGPAAPYRPRRRRSGLLRLALATVLVLICANVAWHAFASLFFVGPLVWAFVILAALFVIGRSRRSRP
jgi:hypothetical protein